MAEDVQHERELREQWQVSHERVHVLEQDAIGLARAAIEAKLEGMNELRAQINTERGQYVTRAIYDAQMDVLRNSTDSRLKLLEQSKSNIEGRMWMMGAGISGAVLELNLVLHYFGKK